jgi:hypothetical protein
MVAPTDCSILRENVGASIARPSECNNIHQEHSHINYNLLYAARKACIHNNIHPYAEKAAQRAASPSTILLNL